MIEISKTRQRSVPSSGSSLHYAEPSLYCPFPGMGRERLMDKLIVGCGYLGTRVAALWLGQGQRVLATTRTPGAWTDSRPEPIVCDVLLPDTLCKLPLADTVVYAVGFDRTSGASMRSVYVDGLANVIEHLPAPGKFIYISSSSVYGQADGGWVDEESATEPEEASGQIVLAAEKLLQSRLPEAVILRFAGIYGPGRLLRQKTIQAGEPIVGDGARWLNLIHVDDGARAVLAAEEHAHLGRVYNVCDDHPVQRREFYTALAKQMGAPEPRFVAPPVGFPAPPHEKGNRRLRNSRMYEELQVTLHYPRFDAGIKASLV
jgi:nucleoside-diphosphate-sugar epimerase